jgi:AcrR family transcriptional regulator
MAGRPRVHTHLSRDAIARAGLSIVDEDGADALTMRAVAAALGVGTMTIYRYVPDRGALVRDIVGSFLAEVDTTAVPGETWDQTLRRAGRSLRAATLRHPQAFALVAAAPVTAPPVLDYARRVSLMHAGQGVPFEVFVEIWSAVDAYLTGFMGMLAGSVIRQRAEEAGERPAADDALSAGLARAVSEQAFETGLSVLIAGLRATIVGDAEPETP